MCRSRCQRLSFRRHLSVAQHQTTSHAAIIKVESNHRNGIPAAAVKPVNLNQGVAASAGAPALAAYPVDSAVTGHTRNLFLGSRQPSPGTACGVVAKR